MLEGLNHQILNSIKKNLFESVRRGVGGLRRLDLNLRDTGTVSLTQHMRLCETRWQLSAGEK